MEGTTRRRFLLQCCYCAFACAGMKTVEWAATCRASRAQTLQKGFLGHKLSPYFTRLKGEKIRCELCPRRCEVDDGERGYCRVRVNEKGQYYSLAYGNPCAVHVDPIEKKPFFHVLPGTLSFSIATAGCNLDCKFCQNWEISQTRPDDTTNYSLSARDVVEYAVKNGCVSIASTYVEPTIFTEYMIDIGELARKHRVIKVMHSNGFINIPPLDDLCKVLNAACIDLKGFTEDYYRDLTEGSLEPVLNTLKRLKQLQVHTEIVNLVVPGKNDDMEKIRSMCRWIRDELGAEVPLHFSRFYPLYKLKSLEPTPVATLERAWKTATEEGLRFVYIGNVPGRPEENTFCPKCRACVIERNGYRVKAFRLTDGRCQACGQPIPGIWELPDAEKI